MEGGDTDDVIYHYTDSKGLIGILSDGQFWATDIRYLNDSSEQLYAEAVFQSFLDQLGTEFPENSEEQTILAFCRRKAHWQPRVGGPLSSAPQQERQGLGELESRRTRLWLNEAFATYVACFSEERDLVTQWNMYGSRGSGFSIGIDRQKLTEMIQPKPASNWLAGISTGVEMIRVQYSEEDQTRHLRGIFEKYLNELRDRRSSASVLWVDGCAGQIVFEAGLSASYFKHPCFRSEAEWRIVITSPGLIPSPSSHELSFRPSARTVIPYVRTPQAGVPKQEGRKLPVVSITIGPTLHQELSMRSVETLLRAKGYSTNEVEIRRSELPLALTD